MGESGQVQTYAELDERSARLANLFRAQGMQPGDHIAVLMENHLRFLELIWGALRSGLYVTPLNRYLTAPEIAYILDDCGADALITSTALREVARAATASADLRLRLCVGGTAHGFEDYESALAGAAASPAGDEVLGEFMCYSSGTTGQPKGVLKPLSGRPAHEGLAMAPALATLYGVSADTVYLSPAPLYHAAPVGFCTGVQCLGGTVVIMERFNEIEALKLIEQHRVSVSQWVPTMFVRMLKCEAPARSGFDLSSHQLALHAAAPCPVPVKEEMIRWWGPILVEYYTGTEGSGLTVCTSAEWLAHKGSVGRAVLGSLHICDDDGTELSAGQTGTVYFEQPAAPFEYHKDSAKTAASRHPEHANWTTMGDVGHVDADGYLYLTDRRSFTIISGGVNIYPQEIENVLVLHPDVLDAAVIGVPDDEFGESVKAVVELVPGAVDSSDLRDGLVSFCREHVAGYKVPRSVDIVDALPRLPTGKLYKQKLTARFADAGPTRLPPELTATNHRNGPDRLGPAIKTSKGKN